MRKIKLISIITVVMALLLAGCGSNEKKITELTENAELALEHDEYDVSFDYYKQILDMDPENLKARYGIEDVFKNSLYQKEFGLIRDIYSYVYNLDSSGESVSKMQDMIKQYDKDVLSDINEAIVEAAISEKNKGIKNITDVNVELNEFIDNYDSGFKEELLSNPYYSKHNISSDIIYFDADGNIIYLREIRLVIVNWSSHDIGLYIDNTEGNSSGEPIYSGIYDESYKEFSAEIPSKFRYIKAWVTITNPEYTDMDGNHYILLNKEVSVIPSNLIGCVIYNETTDEYYLVESSGNIGRGVFVVSEEEAKESLRIFEQEGIGAAIGYMDSVY